MTLLIVELNSFHVELLPMYRPLFPSLLDRRLDVRYFVLPALVDRARGFVGTGVKSVNPSWLRYLLPTKPLRALYYRRRIEALVDELQPDVLVFNTIEPDVFFQLFQQIRHPLKIGVVHNPRREGIDCRARNSGELIFCLHEYNYRRLRADNLVDGYLSPFFGYPSLDVEPRSDSHVEVVIQGIISFNRRDYPFLVSLAEHLERVRLDKPVVFNILGDARLRDGPRLKAMVQNKGLKHRFRFHSGLSDRRFFAELSRADFLMPLLNDRSDSYIGAAKVTNAYGHSGAYGTPMILPCGIADLWEVPHDSCLTFRNHDDLIDRLARGLNQRDTLATRYRQHVQTRIRRNEGLLHTIARNHPALRDLHVNALS